MTDRTEKLADRLATLIVNCVKYVAEKVSNPLGRINMLARLNGVPVRCVAVRPLMSPADEPAGEFEYQLEFAGFLPLQPHWQPRISTWVVPDEDNRVVWCPPLAGSALRKACELLPLPGTEHYRYGTITGLGVSDRTNVVVSMADGKKHDTPVNHVTDIATILDPLDGSLGYGRPCVVVDPETHAVHVGVVCNVLTVSEFHVADYNDDRWALVNAHNTILRPMPKADPDKINSVCVYWLSARWQWGTIAGAKQQADGTQLYVVKNFVADDRPVTIPTGLVIPVDFVDHELTDPPEYKEVDYAGIEERVAGYVSKSGQPIKPKAAPEAQWVALSVGNRIEAGDQVRGAGDRPLVGWVPVASSSIGYVLRSDDLQSWQYRRFTKPITEKIKPHAHSPGWRQIRSLAVLLPTDQYRMRSDDQWKTVPPSWVGHCIDVVAVFAGTSGAQYRRMTIVYKRLGITNKDVATLQAGDQYRPSTQIDWAEIPEVWVGETVGTIMGLCTLKHLQFRRGIQKKPAPRKKTDAELLANDQCPKCLGELDTGWECAACELDWEFEATSELVDGGGKLQAGDYCRYKAEDSWSDWGRIKPDWVGSSPSGLFGAQVAAGCRQCRRPRKKVAVENNDPVPDPGAQAAWEKFKAVKPHNVLGDDDKIQEGDEYLDRHGKWQLVGPAWFGRSVGHMQRYTTTDTKYRRPIEPTSENNSEEEVDDETTNGQGTASVDWGSWDGSRSVGVCVVSSGAGFEVSACTLSPSLSGPNRTIMMHGAVMETPLPPIAQTLGTHVALTWAPGVLRPIQGMASAIMPVSNCWEDTVIGDINHPALRAWQFAADAVKSLRYRWASAAPSVTNYPKYEDDTTQPCPNDTDGDGDCEKCCGFLGGCVGYQKHLQDHDIADPANYADAPLRPYIGADGNTYVDVNGEQRPVAKKRRPVFGAFPGLPTVSCLDRASMQQDVQRASVTIEEHAQAVAVAKCALLEVIIVDHHRNVTGETLTPELADKHGQYLYTIIRQPGWLASCTETIQYKGTTIGTLTWGTSSNLEWSVNWVPVNSATDVPRQRVTARGGREVL